MAEKTEQPTPKKLQDARKKGQVAKSQDLTDRIIGKYYAYIDKTKHWRRVYIRITPTRMKSWDGGATGHAWGARYIERTR